MPLLISTHNQILKSSNVKNSWNEILYVITTGTFVSNEFQSNLNPFDTVKWLIFHLHTDINPFSRSLFILMQHPFSPTEWYMHVNPIRKITEMIFHKQIKACTDPQQIKISSSKDRFLITQKCFSFFLIPFQHQLLLPKSYRSNIYIHAPTQLFFPKKSQRRSQKHHW